MQNLIYLIIMVLAGGAGWYAGGWSGRDAVAAVQEYKQKGEQAEAALKLAEVKLKDGLAAQQAKFDAERQKLGDAQLQQTKSYEATIAGNQQQIAALSKQSAGKLADIARLTKQRDDAKTPEARKAAEVQLQTVVVEQKAVQTEIDGRQCLPVPVPLAVLADWRAVQP